MTPTRTTTCPQSHPRSLADAAFSLIELLVVITIIAVIAGILLGGASLVSQGAKESQAQTLLTNLMGNAGQYEVKTTKAIEQIDNATLINWNQAVNRNSVERQNDPTKVIDGTYTNEERPEDVTYSNGVSNYDYMERANLYIERFIWAANQLPEIRNNLPSLGGSFADIDDDGFMEVIDPWGNPVAYASEVSHTSGATLHEFLPAHDSPFFASAGKDQKWGLPKSRGEFGSDAAWAAYQDTDEYKDAQDNLYSFDLDRSQSSR